MNEHEIRVAALDLIFSGQTGNELVDMAAECLAEALEAGCQTCLLPYHDCLCNA